MNNKVIKVLRKGKVSISVGAFFLCLLIIEGCSVSFPKDKLEGSLIRLCKDKYDIDVDVVIKGKTLGAEFLVDSLYDETNLYISPQTIEKIEKVMLSLSRVSLSTDADFDFLVLLVRDNSVMKVGMKLTRCMDDIKKFINGMMSRDDYFYSLVVKHQIGEASYIKGLLKDLIKDRKILEEIDSWGDELEIEDVEMDDFLQQQITRRLEMLFKTEEMRNQFYLRGVKGGLESSTREEQGVDFVFHIDIEKIGGESINKGDEIEITRLCQNIAGKTLKRYNFKDYNEVKIEIDSLRRNG